MAATGLVDLRSDTVTRPSAGMRRAMAEAEVGDDVFGDDPTVNRLQERAAALFGFESVTFTVSGSMASAFTMFCTIVARWNDAGGILRRSA